MDTARRTRTPHAAPGLRLLRLGISLVSALAILAGVCERTHYPEAVLAMFSVTVCFWIAHVAHAPIRSANDAMRMLSRALRELTSLALTLLVVMIPLAIVLPQHGCYSERAKVAEMLNTAARYKLQVVEAAAKLGTLEGSGVGIDVVATARLAGGFVADDGTIVAVSGDPPAAVVLRPALSGGNVTWTCRGVPRETVPISCRD